MKEYRGRYVYKRKKIEKMKKEMNEGKKRCIGND